MPKQNFVFVCGTILAMLLIIFGLVLIFLIVSSVLKWFGVHLSPEGFTLVAVVIMMIGNLYIHK